MPKTLAHAATQVHNLCQHCTTPGSTGGAPLYENPKFCTTTQPAPAPYAGSPSTRLNSICHTNARAADPLTDEPDQGTYHTVEYSQHFP